MNSNVNLFVLELAGKTPRVLSKIIIIQHHQLIINTTLSTTAIIVNRTL